MLRLKFEEAVKIKNESEKLRKKKLKLEKIQHIKNEKKRDLIYRSMQNAQHKLEIIKLKKQEEGKKMRQSYFQKEERMIKKKENQARKLETIEAEILKRLKDTH